MNTEEETQRKSDWSKLLKPLYEKSCHGNETPDQWASNMADMMVDSIRGNIDGDYSRPPRAPNVRHGFRCT